MPCLWLHSYKTTVHEMFHITNAVERRHLFHYISLFVVKKFNLMRFVQVIVNRILITVIFLMEYFIIRCLFGQVFDEVRNLVMTFVLPWVDISPMLVKRLLNLFHLFDSSFFCIALHTTIDGGVNLQTFCVVCICTIFTIILLAPFFHPVGYCLTEVVGFTIVCILYTIVEFDVDLF